MDLTKLQSAKTITDPEEIIKCLGERESVKQGQMDVKQEDDKAKVIKHFGDTKAEHALPDSSKLKDMAEQVGIKWTEGMEDRVVAYWASDSRVDRHGDIVMQDWDFTDFKKNPVVPFSHNWDMPPIGNSIHWEVKQRLDSDYQGEALLLYNLFASEETWKFADTIFRLVNSGFLKSSSVGFYPGKVIRVEDDKEREALGMPKHGYILANNSLIEHSPTTVPANPGANRLNSLAGMKSMLKEHDVFVIRELERQMVEKGAGDSKSWTNKDAAIINVWKSLFPSVQLCLHKELDTPVILDEQAELRSSTDISDELSTALKLIQEASMKLTDKEEAVTNEPDADDAVAKSDEDIQLDFVTEMLS